jgi:hypothetical protein
MAHWRISANMLANSYRDRTVGNQPSGSRCCSCLFKYFKCGFVKTTSARLSSLDEADAYPDSVSWLNDASSDVERDREAMMISRLSAIWNIDVEGPVLTTEHEWPIEKQGVELEKFLEGQGL